ncbi:MAG: crossover junction endodeoxyribonuclease RuvC [Clostridia bacterium]
MRVLGIDPGFATIGFGVLDFSNNKFKTIDYGVITTPPKIEFSTRLEMIYDDLTLVCNKYSPDAVSVEELFFNTNIKTAIAVGHARGVILLAAKKCGISMFEYTPLQVKQSVVGYGRADKNQVQQLTKTILGLSEIPKPDDAADALALAICHAHCSGSILNKY